MTKAAIGKLTINIGDLELTLSLDEARDLKKCLDELFPAPVRVEYERYPWWYRDYYRPYWGTSVYCAANTLSFGNSDLPQTSEEKLGTLYSGTPPNALADSLTTGGLANTTWPTSATSNSVSVAIREV